MDWFFLVVICLLLVWCLTGCTGQIPSATPKIIQQLDLSGTLDGVAWDGIAVGSSAQAHDIKIQSKTDVNYMTIQSCHRFEKYEDVIKTGWFEANRGFEYQYSESPGIEDNGLCILRLSAYSKQIGAGESYGLMLFHNSFFNLTGENICNGADGITTGTSICQSMSGLVQRLKFKDQVVVSSNQKNDPIQCVGNFIDANTWEYAMPTGECMVVFMTTAKPRKFYVHLAYGFNKSVYRGN